MSGSGYFLISSLVLQTIKPCHLRNLNSSPKELIKVYSSTGNSVGRQTSILCCNVYSILQLTETKVTATKRDESEVKISRKIN